MLCALVCVRACESVRSTGPLRGERRLMKNIHLSIRKHLSGYNVFRDKCTQSTTIDIKRNQLNARDDKTKWSDYATVPAIIENNDCNDDDADDDNNKQSKRMFSLLLILFILTHTHTRGREKVRQKHTFNTFYKCTHLYT